MNLKKILYAGMLAMLFVSCKKENTVVYKGFDYSDWLNREIAEEYKVEFNLDDNTFQITETELSFPKDKALLEVERVFITKGVFTGNPQEDGKIVFNAQEYSEDNVNWITDAYNFSYDIENNQFETEYYQVKKIENLKEHKEISKKMNNFSNVLSSIWENQLNADKIKSYFEKAEKVSTELLLLCDSSTWTEEDTFYFNRLNKTLETYKTLFKE
ncbi:MAG: hypothetical protein MJ179_10180 [Treponema sp.]|nr:hypothetical protein [Treponema sp.]